jgi:pimeloyl-ACP methyl ester carboxylesterase
VQTEKKLASIGGVPISYRTMGAGPPVLLVHGFLSDAVINWVTPGTAAGIAAAGYRVLLPDLRGHGTSGAPESADAYPPDILAMDMAALLAAENCPDAVLVGYSLGARTVVRMIARGARPPKAVLGGMGLSGILDHGDRQDFFITAIENRDVLQKDDPGQIVARFLKSTGSNPHAALHVLRSQVASTEDELASCVMPILVIAGDRDHDNGSAADLAAALPNARFVDIKGNHMTAVGNPALARAIVGFLQN